MPKVYTARILVGCNGFEPLRLLHHIIFEIDAVILTMPVPNRTIHIWCVLKESNLLPTSHLIMATVLQTASGDKTHCFVSTVCGISAHIISMLMVKRTTDHSAVFSARSGYALYHPILTPHVIATGLIPRTRPFDPCFLRCRPRNSFPVYSHHPNKIGYQLCWSQ
jgi:hypothetical protein